MRKITIILFLLITTITSSQEFFQIAGTEKILSSKDSIQPYLNQTKTNYNKTSVEKYGYIVKGVNFNLGETVKRNDSIITYVQLSLDMQKIDYKRDGIFALQNKMLPDLNFTTLNNSKVNNQTLKDKVTLINLWYVNCAPCLKEIPELNKIKSEFKDKVNFLAITFDSKEKIESFLIRKPFDFDIIPNQKEFLDNILKPESYPKILIVDKQGIVKLIFNGLNENEIGIDDKNNTISKNTLKSKMNELIAQ